MADEGGNKRVAIIGVSSILLVAMVIAVTVGVNNNNGGGDSGGEAGSGTGHGDNLAASKKAITAICQPADYRASCEESLEKSAGNVTDPKELVKVAFTIAQKSIGEAIVKSDTLKELDSDPRTHEALVTCRELMNMSITEIEDCLTKQNLQFSNCNSVLPSTMLLQFSYFSSASAILISAPFYSALIKRQSIQQQHQTVS